MTKAEIIGIVVAITGIFVTIILFSYEKAEKDEPSLSIENDHKSIVLNNKSNASAEIIEAIYILNNDIFCLNNNNISKHLGSDYFKFEVSSDQLNNDTQIGTGSSLILATCKTNFCNELYLDSPLNSITPFLKYKGTGFFNRTKTTCGIDTQCKTFFESENSSCKEA